MASPEGITVSGINYHIIVQDVTGKDSLQVEGPGLQKKFSLNHANRIPALIFDIDECLSKKHTSDTGGRTGIDTEGEAFLPWCLMRCAEAASDLSIKIILVAGDDPAWQLLQTVSSLVDAITGVRVARIDCSPYSPGGHEAHQAICTNAHC